MLQTILEQIGAQAKAVSDAPLPYVVGGLIVWVVAWFLGRQRLSDALRGKDSQIAALKEWLALAHEKNDAAKREFESLKAEMDRRELLYRTFRGTFEQRSAPVVAPHPRAADEHSLSTSVHSVNLDRLLTDVSTATAGGQPRLTEFNPFSKKPGS